jgi:hypothetical protein
MELWDRSYLDLEGPAHITFDRGRLGRFQFGAVYGSIDYRLGTRDGKTTVEFSWEGRNDADAMCGRGWAVFDGDRLTGRLYLHDSDDSAFVALRESRAQGRSAFPPPGA